MPTDWYKKAKALGCKVIVCEYKLWNEETIRGPIEDGVIVIDLIPDYQLLNSLFVPGALSSLHC